MANVASLAPANAGRDPAYDPLATLDPAILPYLDLLKRGALPIATSTVDELRRRTCRAGSLARQSAGDARDLSLIHI